jgi:hypothetical protein
MGALDVQSLQRNPFSSDDIGILQALANQIAIAIENASLLTEQQRAVEENQRLAEQSQHQLAQIQELNRQLTREAWTTFVGNQDLSPALTVDFASGTMTPNAEWTPGLAEAIRGHVTAPEGEAAAGIAVPLIVRGQVIGAMEFELEDGELNRSKPHWCRTWRPAGAGPGKHPAVRGSPAAGPARVGDQRHRRAAAKRGRHGIGAGHGRPGVADRAQRPAYRDPAGDAARPRGL